MVIAIHTGAFRELGWLGGNIADNGKYGVQIFFVISGFTIAQTFCNARGFWPYFGRRVMRIAPLYYAMILLGFALIATATLPHPYWMEFYGSEPSLYNLLMHLSFLSAWDPTIAPSILGVEWTIPIEMFWYVTLALLLPVSGDRRAVFKVFGVLLVLSALTRGLGQLYLPPAGAHFNPLTYGAYFYLGAVADQMRSVFREREKPWKRQRLWLCYAVFGLALITDIGVNSALLGLATAGIIVFYDHNAARAKLLTWRPMLFLGSISYSLYLIHYLAITIVNAIWPAHAVTGTPFFVLITALTIVLSTATYLLIERPSNRLGKAIFGAQRGT